jgi:hypothetical protein
MATETPTRARVLIYEPYRFQVGEGGGGVCRSSMLTYDYHVTDYAQAGNPHLNPNCTVTLFRQLISSGDYGVVHIVSHGSERGFAVEVYGFTHAGRTARDQAFADYLANGYTNDQLYASEADNQGYHISVKPAALTAWFVDRKSIVFVASCHSSALNAAWHARDVLGYSDAIPATGVDTDAKIFYPRLIGTKDRGTGNTKREVGQAVAGIRTELEHLGDGHTVLAPIVLDYAPKGSIICSTDTEGFVAFDSTVDTAQDPKKAITASGCDIALTKQAWDGDRRLKFVARASKCPSEARFRVDFRYAESANNHIKLDGNKLPLDTDGVSPNRDYYEWKVECRVPSTTQPGTTRPPPPEDK